MDALTKRERAELKRLDRKIMGGKAARKEILRGIDLKLKARKNEAAAAS